MMGWHWLSVAYVLDATTDRVEAAMSEAVTTSCGYSMAVVRTNRASRDGHND